MHRYYAHLTFRRNNRVPHQQRYNPLQSKALQLVRITHQESDQRLDLYLQCLIIELTKS